MRKTALMTGVAGLLLMAAPAIAQDATSPQTPPASAEVEADAAVEAETQAPTLSLKPGAVVQGADGQLGVLVGARLHAGAQQLTVKGEDGVIRAVPIDGIRQEGEVVVVDFTLEQYAEAETIAEAATPAVPAVPAEPGVAPATPATPAVPGVPAPAPTVPADATDDANPPATERPVAPPPTLPPENPAEPEDPPAPTPATPVPGEGADQEPDA